MSSKDKVDQAFFGVSAPPSAGSGTQTPHVQISQTPVLENNNPFDKESIPTEARHQQIVGLPGDKVDDSKSKLLLALDGSESGDRAFKYLLDTTVISRDSHVFLTTVLPSSVLGTSWVSGPLSINPKQNEMLQQIRTQAIERLAPYKKALREVGFSVTMHILHGDIRASLLKVLNFHKVELVLVGKRSRTWKKGLSSGTVSTYLVSHSPVPVLVIK